MKIIFVLSGSFLPLPLFPKFHEVIKWKTCLFLWKHLHTISKRTRRSQSLFPLVQETKRAFNLEMSGTITSCMVWKCYICWCQRWQYVYLHMNIDDCGMLQQIPGRSRIITVFINSQHKNQCMIKIKVGFSMTKKNLNWLFKTLPVSLPLSLEYFAKSQRSEERWP